MGAVSPETASQMAEGVKALSGADYGISTTGIAGPTGGSGEKPVGLVYIDVCGKNGAEIIKAQFGDADNPSRENIRRLSSDAALYFCLKSIANF